VRHRWVDGVKFTEKYADVDMVGGKMNREQNWRQEERELWGDFEPGRDGSGGSDNGSMGGDEMMVDSEGEGTVDYSTEEEDMEYTERSKRRRIAR
jgi:hypothetical protein